MNKLTVCTLLTFCLASAQINLGDGDGGDGVERTIAEGEADANTRIFGDPLNQFLLTTGAVVTGNVATGVLGTAFNAFRDKCRFRRRKRQTEDGEVEVNTRLICPQDLLPADCDRCDCYRDRNCGACARCRPYGGRPYGGPYYNQNNYNNYNNNYKPYRPSSYRPSSTTTGWSSWTSTSSYRPTYVYRSGTRFRIAENGDEILDPETSGSSSSSNSGSGDSFDSGSSNSGGVNFR